MKLVIAEKPSVAQSLAAVIGATARKERYLEGNGWRVSWCLGHLLAWRMLTPTTRTTPSGAMTICPFLPKPWQMVVSKDKKKQFDMLKRLMNATDELKWSTPATLGVRAS